MKPQTMLSPSLADLYSLVADLIQMLIDAGTSNEDLIYLLKQYNISEEQAKEWYGIPYVAE
jgi:hypothetical protein